MRCDEEYQGSRLFDQRKFILCFVERVIFMVFFFFFLFSFHVSSGNIVCKREFLLMNNLILLSFCNVK